MTAPPAKAPAEGTFTRLRRRIARAIAPETQGQRSMFNAAAFNRLTMDYVFAHTRSADGELRYELRTMRNRARDLVRNSPFGIRYHQLLAENIIGPTGIQLHAKNLKKDGKDPHETANASIEASWCDFGRVGNCDATRRLSMTEFLCLAVSNWGTDGEILIRILAGPRYGPYGIRFQLLDPDLLDENLNREASGSGPGKVNAIHQGVELDDDGAPVAYWLWTRNPYDNAGTTVSQDRVRVLAQDIIHAFIPLRPGQSRGIPHAAAIITTLKMLDGYLEAELVAARTASAKMGALEDADPQNPMTRDPNAGESAIPTEADPGALLDLRGMGAKLALWDPQHPTANGPNFVRMMSHYTAMGYGISYGTLTGDLSQANYGSLRIGMLDERNHWERMQQFVIDHVVDRMYREWLAHALNNRMIPGITDYAVSRWTDVLWQAAGFDWIDPVKDVVGDLLEVAAGTFSLTRMAAKRGRNLPDIIDERKRETEWFKDAGVTSTIATTITDRPTNETDPGDTSNDTNNSTDSTDATDSKDSKDSNGKSWNTMSDVRHLRKVTL